MIILIHDYGGYAFSLQLARRIAHKGEEVFYIHGGSTQVVQRFTQADAAPESLHLEGVSLAKPFEKYTFVKRWQQEREYGKLLQQRIDAIQPDVIVSANAPLDVQQLLWRAGRRYKIPLVFWWQDIISVAMRALLQEKYGYWGGVIGRYYESMERSLLKQSTRIIAISDDFLPLAKKWDIPPEKISVLPNWAPLAEINVLPKKNHWSQKHHLVDKFIFLYAGILGLKHDLSIFIALAEAFRPMPDVLILVVSEGLGADWLKTQKGLYNLTNLQIMPFQDYADFPNLLASADILLAVLNEKAGDYSVPSKVLSYFCAGRPVLLSAPMNNEAVRNIQNDQTGLATAPQNTDEFCQLALLLYQNPQLRQRLGKNARLYAERNFAIEDITKNFWQILQNSF